MKPKKFTEDANEWIIKNHNSSVTIKEFTEQYNKIFCENRSIETMKHHLNRLGLKQKNKGYTTEQEKWLLENCEHLSVKETAEMFNKLFAEKRSEGALKARALKLGVTHKNDRSKQKYQVGAETKLNGITYVKTSNEKKDFYKNWEPKGRVVYKKSYGEIPDGSIIVFLDGNRENFDPENLYAVSGKVAREMAKKRWWGKGRGFSLAAIKWCELFYAIKDQKDWRGNHEEQTACDAWSEK